MRNLKKILALVLALVMSFSLMATANAFTDSEKVTDTYETAVTVLDGLKVFQGYDDGSFQPQGSITRAEVAAIIYRIVTGDVTDTQVGIYADYNKFDDVKSTSWYAGYVNFCANAEYIKGYDAKTFGPNDPVTGYQALAMILRALGYDKNGEFTGTSWQVQTAATGELRGITKNISAGTLGTAASREVVAEILFRAILVDKVNYTPAFGYQLDDTSIGWDTFELEEITGVVIANEYADLYSTSPLKAGKTELDVDGESYTVNYSTDLTDIGEARDAYITGGETVLYIADAGNTVFETGAATDIEKDKDFEKATGLERDDDTTEYFINFDGGAEYKASDWKIKYVLTAADENTKKAYEAEYGIPMTGNAAPYTYTNTINPGKVISDTDMAIMKDIFYSADLKNNTLVVGAVYVGTQSAVDISDDPDVSWKSFQNKYIDTAENVVDFDESDNGEWLKVIDNDGDGVADYVLLTEFAMSVIDRISKDNEYTLADLADDRDDKVMFNDIAKIDGDDIITEDELAEGDVVIYTKIDGNYYMNIAEKVTETIDKKGINSKTETITCDGTDYVQSHIGYTDETNYLWDVTDAHTEDTYDLYLDHFGYVRLLIESDYNVFMLLTDGYYYDNNRTETFQAYYWDVEAGEETQIDVVDNDYANDFIADGKNIIVNGDVNVWGRLLGADVTYLRGDSWRNDYATNIAGYSETADGYALKTVGESANRQDYMVQAFRPDELDDETLDAHGTDADIQTTTETQYYLVIRSEDNRTVSGWDVDDVITWTGYKNAPAEAELNYEDGLVVGYAVTHATKTDGDYTVADVVVFETTAYADRDVYFVYDVNNWDDIEYVWGVGYDESDAIDSENRLLVEDGAAAIAKNGVIEFYKIYDDERVNFIGDPIGAGEYAKNYIYAGEALTGYDVEGRNYIRVDVYGAKNDMYIYDDAPVYYVTYDAAKDTYNVKEFNRDEVDPDDLMIIFANKDGDVKYAITVTDSLWAADADGKKDDIIGAVEELWWDIYADAIYVEQFSLTFYGVKDADGDGVISVPYATAVANAANPDGTGAGLKTTGCTILSTTSNGATATIPATPVKSTQNVTYTVVTKDNYKVEKVWTLTVEAARADAQLLTKDGTEATYADLAMPNRWTIREYVNQFTVSDGATVTWSFKTYGGSDFSFTGFKPANVPAGVTTTEISEVKVTVTAEDDITKNTYTNVATDEEVAIANMIAALQEITSVDATNVNDAQTAVDAAKELGSDDAALAAQIARVETLIAKHNEAVNADFADALEAVQAAIDAKNPDQAQALLNIAELKAVTEEQKDQIAKLQKAIEDLEAKLAYQQFKAAVADAVDAKGSADKDLLTDALNGLNALGELEALKLNDVEKAYLEQLKAEIAAELEAVQNPPVDKFKVLLDRANAAIAAGIDSAADKTAAEGIVEELTDMIQNGSLTQKERRQLVNARTGLNDAIARYDAAQKYLQEQIDSALPALADCYDNLVLDRSDEGAAKAIYDQAVIDIKGAASGEKVDEILIKAISDLNALDKAVKDAGDDAAAANKALVEKLVTAGYEGTDQLVDILLGKDMSVNEIRIALATGAQRLHGDVVPVLYAAEVSVADIFAGYEEANLGGKWTGLIAKDLADAEVPSEEIVSGYVDYWMVDKTGMKNVELTYDEESDLYTVALAEDWEIKDTGLFDMWKNAGVERATVVRASGNWSSTENLADLPGNMAGMITKVLAGQDYTLTIKIDDLTYNVLLTAAEAE